MLIDQKSNKARCRTKVRNEESDDPCWDRGRLARKPLVDDQTAKERYATGLVICALLVLGCLAPAQAQNSKANGARFKELPNFSCVNERLYRGGQPRKGGIRKLAALGVNTIINLRDDDQRAVVEAEEAKAAGLRYFNVPLARIGRPSESKIEQVLSLITAQENGVVFVHCRRGSDRTGTVIAVYRISQNGWTAKEAKDEADRFGMFFWHWAMKDYISDYFRDKAARLGQTKESTPPVRQPCKIPDERPGLSSN